MTLDVEITQKELLSAGGGAHTILYNVNFQLREGEICACLGPSGSGKTTLLRILAGLDSAFKGHVTLPPHRKIGMVFQEPRLLPWRNVAENLQLVSLASETEFAEIITTLGLSRHLNHFPGELSLGLARRVAIARAFIIKPDILLLDEPFVSLDAPLAAKLREELLGLVLKRKATTLMVTHDIEEAISIADRILVLSAAPGHLIADQVIEAPRGKMTKARLEDLKEMIHSIIAADNSSS